MLTKKHWLWGKK